MKNILVIGSVNMDMVINTPRLPNLGETIDGEGFDTIQGGKGANQAIAAAKLGGNVKMIACVGTDIYGKTLMSGLENNGVDISGVETIDGSSGIAIITVCEGDNHIILDKGANSKLSSAIIKKHENLIQWADIVLFQLEIPQEAICTGAKLAKKYGAKVLLNPAPMQKINDEIIKYTDIFVPNSHEAELMLGKKIDDDGDDETAVKELLKLGFEQIIITLGSKGCIYNDGNEIKRHGIYKTTAVDTTAAGDSFIGGFVVALSSGKSVPEAIDYASAVSALTVSRHGASISLPDKAETETFMKNSNQI